MVLTAAGVKVTPEALVDQVYLPGRKGSLQVEMLAAARRNGLIAYELAPQLTDMLREVAAGSPAIVLENYGPFSWYPGVALLGGRRLRSGQAGSNPPLGHQAAPADAAHDIRKNLETRKLLGDDRGAARPRAGDRHRDRDMPMP